MSHSHSECKHDIKYCGHCRVCYCTKCSKQWYEYYYYTYPGTWTNPNIVYTYSANAGPVGANDVTVTYSHNHESS